MTKKEKDAKYQLDNKETLKEKRKIYRLKNKERESQYGKEYNAANKWKKDLIRESEKESRAEKKRLKTIKTKETAIQRQIDRNIKNKDNAVIYYRTYYFHNKISIDAHNKLYSQNNKGIINALCAKRRAAEISATPKWLTKEHLLEIQNIYIEAIRLTKETGIKHEVDHIVPLLGKLVRGLHVPWNLQILTKSENCRKSNKLILLE